MLEVFNLCVGNDSIWFCGTASERHISFISGYYPKGNGYSHLRTGIN